MTNYNESVRALLLSAALLAAVIVLMFTVITQPPGTAHATAAQTATAAVQATQTAAAATPHPERRSKDVRDLNMKSAPGGPKLGDLLLALWNARQSGGALAVATPGPVIDVAALTAVVKGVYVAKTITSAAAITDCGDTTSAQFRKCTVCMDGAGTLRYQPGPVTTVSQAAAMKHPCRDAEVEIAYLELPVSFTSGTTTVTAGMLKQSATAASAVQF